MRTYYVAGIPYSDFLCHHGIKGQKWGRLRFTNPDGSLNELGRRRYGIGIGDNGQDVELVDARAKNMGYSSEQGTGSKSTSSNGVQKKVDGSLASSEIEKANATAKALAKEEANSADKMAARRAAQREAARTGKPTPQQVKTGVNTGRDFVYSAAGNPDEINEQIANTNTRDGAPEPKDVPESQQFYDDMKRQALRDATAESLNTPEEQKRGGVLGWIKDRADDVGDWGRNAWEDTKEAATNVGNWVGDRARDLGNAVSNQDERQRMEELASRAFGTLNGEVQVNGQNGHADNMLLFANPEDEKAYLEAKKAYENHALTKAGNAAQDVGNWVGDRARDVGNWGKGAWEDTKEAATNVGNWVGDRARDVGNAISNQDERQRMEEAASRGQEVPVFENGQLTDKKNYIFNNPEDRKAYEDAKAAYENHAITKNSNFIDSIGNRIKKPYDDTKNWVETAASNVGNWAGNAARDVGDWGRQAYDDASNWVNQAGEDINDYFTGNRTRQNLVDANQHVKDVEDNAWYAPRALSRYDTRAANNGQNIQGAMEEYYNEANRRAANDYEQAKQNYLDNGNNACNTVSRYLNIPGDSMNWVFNVPGNEQYLGNIDRFYTSPKNLSEWFTGSNYKKMADMSTGDAKWMDDMARKMGESEYFGPNSGHTKDALNYADQYRREAAANRNLYKNAPQQRLAGVYNDAKNWVDTTARNVGDWAGNAYGDASNWAGNAARDVGDWGRNAWDNVSGWAGNIGRDIGIGGRQNQNAPSNPEPDLAGLSKQAIDELARRTRKFIGLK